ncbi:MAG: immunoglobulin domain-containing protein [Verrucomicrobia bacterium]|nr:immunoglobulin domain-containing protein [Verrucomicrobiota bacterium]
MNPGQRVSISVSADGTQPFTYQWYKDGVVIPKATEASFTIDSATAADSASYKARVTNSINYTDSDAAVLKVAPPPPTITTQLAAKTNVIAGQSVELKVVATGSGALSYQWTKNGTNISGATSSTYKIASAAAADAGNYNVIVINTVNSVASAPTTSSTTVLTVVSATAAPTITTQPSPQSVSIGDTVFLKVEAAGAGTLSYQWAKNGSNISGATSATYTIPMALTTHAGNYSVVVSNANGSTTSNSVALSVAQDTSAFRPDSAAATTTGGATGPTVPVSTAAELKLNAESPTACVINVSGTISLSGPIMVKSNKTIQGQVLVDSTGKVTLPTIMGSLDLSSGGVSNVIIRGLTITNPGTTGGTGIVVRNASNVFITHCTLFDCNGDLIEISNGSDGVTVSWSEFYYSSAYTGSRSTMRIGLPSVETKPLRVTLHHNWWADGCGTNMPLGTYGYVHLYNNYFKATGNTSAAKASDNSQFLVEHNVFEQINDPLSKQNVDTTKSVGRIYSSLNLFSPKITEYTDAVLTPSYSYELLPAEDVAIYSTQFAGNTAGASSATPSARAASITGPGAAVAPGSTFALTAVHTGFSGVSYQWRLNNFDIARTTSAKYDIASMQTANAGTYSVVIETAAGDYVVSSSFSVTLGTAPGPDNSSSSSSSSGASSSGGGGGGAPGVGYLAALFILGALRQALRRNAKKA